MDLSALRTNVGWCTGSECHMTSPQGITVVRVSFLLCQQSEQLDTSVPARKDRQYPGVAVKVIPCDLAAGEESHQRHLT
jgi:hypothetical protein